MKKINVIGLIYFIVFTFVTLAVLLESFLSVSTGAVGAFPWLLLIFLLAIALGVFGIIWASALRAHKAWSWPWGITFVSIGLISGIYSFLVVSILYIITVLFNAFVLYALISEKELFFPPQPDLAGQRQSLGRMLIVPIIVSVVLILGFGLAYYYIYSSVNNHIVPAENDVFVQTAITDILVNASNYSMSKGSAQGNYLGYQSTLPPNETPDCSGPLVINISPDGSQMAIFGKSCTAPVYYCSALPIPESSLGSDNNYNQSMPTVPASLVTANKYDCNNPASQNIELTVPTSVVPPVAQQASASINNVSPTGTSIHILKVSDYYTITWSTSNVPNDATTSINLEVNGNKILIATNIPTTQNSYTWHVYKYPANLTGIVEADTKYDFNVSATYNRGGSYVANISSGFYIQ